MHHLSDRRAFYYGQSSCRYRPLSVKLSSTLSHHSVGRISLAFQAAGEFLERHWPAAETHKEMSRSCAFVIVRVIRI